MQQFFATMFEDVRHERPSKWLLSLTDPDILKQSKFTDHKIDVKKILPPEEVHRQRVLKEYTALHLLE